MNLNRFTKAVFFALSLLSISTAPHAKELHNQDLLNFISIYAKSEGLSSDDMFNAYLDLVDIEDHSYDEISKTISIFEKTLERQNRVDLYSNIARKLDGNHCKLEIYAFALSADIFTEDPQVFRDFFSSLDRKFNDCAQINLADSIYIVARTHFYAMQLPELYENSVRALTNIANNIDLPNTTPRAFASVYHALSVGTLYSCYKNDKGNCPDSYDELSGLMRAMAKLNTSGYFYDETEYFNGILRDTVTIERAYGVPSPFYN